MSRPSTCSDASHVRPITIALRNKALPPDSPNAWVTLDVTMHMPPNGLGDEPPTLTPVEPPPPTHWEGTWKETAPFYASPESRSGRKPLHGSFSRGPSAIWRKVELPDRPPFYYSEQFGISTWKRPLPPPPMHPIAIPSTDFRAVQPEWDLLTDEDRRNLLYGLQRLSELQVPTAPPPPAHGEVEEGEEGEEEEEEGGRYGAQASRLPLLSVTAKQQGADLLPSEPLHLDVNAMRARKQSKLVEGAASEEVAASRTKRLEHARRTKEQLYALQAKMAAKAAAKAATSAERRPERTQESVASSSAVPSAPAPSFAGGAELINPALAAKLAALFDEPQPKKTELAPKPPDAPKPQNPARASNLYGPSKRVAASMAVQPLSLKQIEDQLVEKCKALRSDEQALHKLRDQIHREKLEVQRAKMQAPGYVDFVRDKNPKAVPEFAWARRVEQLGEKARQRREHERDHHERYTLLVQDELHRAVVSARGRLQADPLGSSVGGDPSTLLLPGLGSPRTPALPPRKGPSTLKAGPGTMYSKENAKGRARRLAAMLNSKAPVPSWDFPRPSRQQPEVA